MIDLQILNKFCRNKIFKIRIKEKYWKNFVYYLDDSLSKSHNLIDIDNDLLFIISCDEYAKYCEPRLHGFYQNYMVFKIFHINENKIIYIDFAKNFFITKNKIHDNFYQMFEAI